MSTSDRAFIRAYAKDADLRGAEPPSGYAPPHTDRQPEQRPEKAAPPNAVCWSVEQLYSEGAWYRVESRQQNAPVPHMHPSWFASAPSAPVPPRRLVASPATRSTAGTESSEPAVAEATVRKAAVEEAGAEEGAAEQSAVEEPAGDKAAAEEAAATEPREEPRNEVHSLPDEPDHGPVLHASETATEKWPGAGLSFATQFLIAASFDCPPARADDDPPPVHQWAGWQKSPPADATIPSPSRSPSPTAPPNASAVVQRETAPTTEPSGQAAASAAPPRPETVAPATTGNEEQPGAVEDVEELPPPAESARLDLPAEANIPTPHFPLAARSQTNVLPQQGGSALPQRGSTSAVDTRGPDAAEHDAAPQTAGAETVKPDESSRASESAAEGRPTALVAAWEVDALAWPELTDRLLRRETLRFKELAERLEGVAAQGRNVVAVTSPQRRQGRTTLSLCLARRLAANGRRVALVDADFDNPQLAQRLRLNPTCGWQDTVGTDLSLCEAAVASLGDEVTLFPLRVASVERSVDQLDTTDVAQVIDHLSRTFDVVLLDMEPVEPVEEAPPGSSTLHRAVVGLLVYNAASPPEQLAQSVVQLRAVGIETIGAVENLAVPSNDV